jgi:hypothetical protein
MLGLVFYKCIKFMLILACILFKFNIMKIKGFYIVFVFILCTVFAYANVIDISDLRNTYGKNKNIPEEYELQCLIALSYFPELKDVPIEFRFKDIHTTMSARPKFRSVFKSSSQREYLITINNKPREEKGVLLDELSFNAQIGIMAHELAHLVDYSKKSSARLLLCGTYYITSEYFHQNLERKTDLIVIERGLGLQLFDFSDYVINHSDACDQYKKFKMKYYYKPEEIKEAIAKLDTVY